MNSRKTQFFVHFLKYGIIGLFNTVFTFLIYYVLLKHLEFHYLTSFSISWISGVLFTYALNFVWTFKPEKKLEFRSRFVKYLVVYVTSFGINFVLLKVVTESTLWDPLWVQVLILPLVVAINFAGIKYWSLAGAHRSL